MYNNIVIWKASKIKTQGNNQWGYYESSIDDTWIFQGRFGECCGKLSSSLTARRLGNHK